MENGEEESSAGAVESYASPVCLPPDKAVLALGGDLKSIVSLMRAGEVCSSAMLGDLADADVYRRFVATVREFQTCAGPSKPIIVHDMHPGFLSTAMAKKSTCDRLAVQHHHAHIVSCLADNNHPGPVIGVACDGTGYGTDRAIWGCEVLVCDLRSFEQAGQLRYFLLPGGDAAARETWRPALSLVRETFGDGWRDHTGDIFNGVPVRDLSTVERMLQREINCVPTSSLGRLFDAVAFLLGLCSCNRTDAQAAIALEKHADNGHAGGPLPFELVPPPNDNDNRVVIDVRPTIRAVVDRMIEGRNSPDLAIDFHETLIAMLAATVEMTAERTGIRHAALSGGCFLNRRLHDGLTDRLRRGGMTVLRHSRVPVGDAGLSFGQAIIAAARISEAPCSLERR